MSVIKFKGHKAASGKNADYITRESACDSISFHNLDELRGENDYENKINARSYAYNREDEETGRSHYRVTLAFDRKEETEKAQTMAHDFLKENFADARGIVSIHQDTEHTHAHIWLDSRQIDDKKIHSPKNHINELSRNWQRAYDREYGTNREQEYALKREESRQWREDRHKGIDRPAPERAKMSPEQWREKEAKDLGVERSDEKRIDRNQRAFEVRDSKVEAADRAVTGSEQQINQSKQEFSRAVEGLDRAESAFRETRERLGETRERLRETRERLNELRQSNTKEIDRDKDKNLER